jgi:predicted transcriptional regulator
MTFSTLFLSARRELRITQVQLSQRIGVSQSSISKIEAGILEPSASAFLKVIKLACATRKGERKFGRIIWELSLNIEKGWAVSLKDAA